MLVARIFCLLLFGGFFSYATAQTRYGKVAPPDFQLPINGIDSSSGAIILTDEGNSYFEGNEKGWFTLVHKHYCRIQVLNTAGLDAGTVRFVLYRPNERDEREELFAFKACTYNLENGNVVESKLKEADVFTEKVNRDFEIKKFAFASVKPGSILEYAYTIHSDFMFHLRPWNFQGTYPRLLSTYQVTIPEYFHYVFLSQGLLPYDEATQKSSSTMYYVRQKDVTSSDEIKVKMNPNIQTYKWVMKQVPALKNERYLSSSQNYISRIQFQLSGIQLPGSRREEVAPTWERIVRELNESDEFGAGLYRPNNWMDDALKTIINPASDIRETASQLFQFVQRFQIQESNRYYLSKPLRDVFKSMSGEQQDVNLLLTALLRHVGLDACPVLLSTRENGRPNEVYPFLEDYNYVICRVMLNGETIFLDATHPNLGFGSLSNNLYNGQWRIIDKTQAKPLFRSADELSESSMVSITLNHVPGKPGNWVGRFSTHCSNEQSMQLRQQRMLKSTREAGDQFTTPFATELQADDLNCDNWDDLSSALSFSGNLHYSSANDGNIIYLNLFLYEPKTDNPFVATERKYPVEFPAKIDEVYLLKIDIPEGYVVDEMPKSEKATLNGEDGSLECLIEQSDTAINLRYRFRLNRTFFEAADYEQIRSFFHYAIQKRKQNLIFKKKA